MASLRCTMPVRQAQRCMLAGARHRPRRISCVAELRQRPPQDPVSMVKDECSRFVRRYDVLSSGLGALLVTSFCVSKGQDPVTALSITFMSTVVALVLNEVLFNNQDS